MSGTLLSNEARGVGMLMWAWPGPGGPFTWASSHSSPFPRDFYPLAFRVLCSRIEEPPMQFHSQVSPGLSVWLGKASCCSGQESRRRVGL